MRIEIVDRGLGADGATRRRTKDRIRSVLRRVAGRVERVIVRTTALARRAGSDARECLVIVQIRGGGQIVVRERGESPVGLVIRAIRQARYSLLRRLERGKRR
jgi:hypothetical protein